MKKIYLIHPSYRDQDARLLKGKRLYVVSLALPALSGAIPDEWEKEFCFEYFSDIDFETDASVIGISNKNRIEKVETNRELEGNSKVQAQWKFYDPRQHKRRRCYKKELTPANSV